MTSAILEFRDVSFSRGPRLLLDRMSFGIEKQEMVALLGPNGVGKTTMLKLASRLLQPGDGTVLLQGEPLAAWPRRELPRAVALVPQELEMPFNFRVEEIVAQGRVPYLPLFGHQHCADREAVENAMESVDIVRLRDRLYSQLSGGERQRVKIAIGLAQQPQAHVARRAHAAPRRGPPDRIDCSAAAAQPARHHHHRRRARFESGGGEFLLRHPAHPGTLMDCRLDCGSSAARAAGAGLLRQPVRPGSILCLAAFGWVGAGLVRNCFEGRSATCRAPPWALFFWVRCSPRKIPARLARHRLRPLRRRHLQRSRSAGQQRERLRLEPRQPTPAALISFRRFLPATTPSR